MKKKGLATTAALLLSIPFVRAHCPLCTIGAAAAAGVAAYLGVHSIVIGVFIGAFAASTGWWFARLIKKKLIPHQDIVVIAASFLMTILPMRPLLGSSTGVYLWFWGTYGKTLIVDVFIIGTLIGLVLLSITPWLSKKLTALRNGKHLPYQGVLLTFGVLIISGVLLQLAS